MVALSTRRLILLVEADACAARGLARMLADDGFEVERVADGAAALARLSRSPLPDVLITDLYLPHVDGVTVARFARSRDSKIATVFITEHAELMERNPPSLSPSPTVLVKPLDYDALARTLHTLLPAAA